MYFFLLYLYLTFFFFFFFRHFLFCNFENNDKRLVWPFSLLNDFILDRMLTKKYGKGLKGKPLVPFTHIHKHIHICLIICNFFWINLYVNYSFKTKTLYVIYLILQNIINFNNLIYGFLQSFFNPCYHYLQKKKNFNIYFFFKQKHQHIRLSLINKYMKTKTQVLLFLDFLLVKVLTIQPCFLTLVPSTLEDATWQEEVGNPDLSLMAWKRWPIRLRHLRDDLALLCSTILVALVIGACCFLHVEFVLSSQAFDTVFLSHDEFPSFSNFIDIKESEHTQKGVINSVILFVC